MKDPRATRLADNLINFSLAAKPGENVLIESYDGNDELVLALIKAAYAAGARPHVWLRERAVERELALGATVEQLAVRAENDAAMMKNMQCYIGIRGGDNSAEMADVPAEKLSLSATHYSLPVHSRIRVPETRWVVMRYPSRGMAQQANMSTEAFEDYYFSVCNLDYSKMDKAMDPLVALMERTDRVRLVGPGTDLSFSIKGLPAIKCSGHINIPDGEVFSAPVRESVNGVISFNTPSLRSGFTFENIVLTFKDGKVVAVDGNDPERINHELDVDEGGRYVGEFALGVNPYINTPMKDTLFDEKIAGSLHFTPGSCYDECYNGNKSALHWDLVLIQTPEYGGGEIYFDGVLIRKDGRFVLPELDCLNPENLI